MQPPDPSVPGGPESVPPSTPPPPPPPGAPPPDPATSASPPPPPGAPASTPSFNCGFLPTPPFEPEPSKDEKLWALITHLGGALGGLTSYIGLPGGNVVIPLIIWLIKRDGSPFLNDQGKEVLNFQICILILSILCIVTCVGVILLVPIGIAALIFGIVGGVKANEGATYRYPLNWRLIK